MDYTPGEFKSFFATSKESLSPKALDLLRVIAFLDAKRIRINLFEPLRRLFAAKNEGLQFNFPITPEDHKEACTELVEASLLRHNGGDKVYTIKREVQTSVMADTHAVGLLPPLFNSTVKVLVELWPRMICVPDRTVGQDEFLAATAPGTTYEAYLKKRYLENRLPLFQEYEQYARGNIWGRRDELVHHVTRLEHIFFHLVDDMIDICATVTFAMLLAEAAWFAIISSLR